MIKSRWLKVVLLVGVCLLLGLIDAIRSYTSAYHDGVFHLQWETAVRWDLIGWMTWVFFIPLIVTLCRRVRINPANWWWSTPVFSLVGLMVASVKTVTPIIVYLAFIQPLDEVLGWLSRKPLFLLTDFLVAFVFYCFVLAFAQALNFYRQYREGELRASQLESQLARSQLQALKMQLHPHFLFNTLHSISALQYENPEAAQKMTARLGDFLRLTLDNSSTPTVSLGREIEFLKCYLDIERVRFGKRLIDDFEIAPDALEAQVPNLILQPLVENAIKHGIAKQAKAGLIRVGAKIENGKLWIEVADNGTGLIQNGNDANGSHNHGLGLSNVRERLRQLYGSNHNFELRKAAEGGLVAMISFPLMFADPVSPALNQHQ